MKNPAARLLERELLFTETYRNHKNAHKAVREQKCMEVQLATYFVPPKEADIIAGRIDRPYVVFAPCFEGDGVDMVGYCMDYAGCQAELNTLLKQGEDADYIARVREMIEFWKEENTNTKIRRRFPASWKGCMGADDFLNDNAAIHPLYRVAGVNMNMKKLLSLGLGGLMAEAKALEATVSDENKKIFYHSVAGALQSVSMVIADYTEYVTRAAKTAQGRHRERLVQMAEALKAVELDAPKTLHQAVQLACIYMLSTRAVEIGRIDDYLCNFYVHDIDNGVLTHQQAIRLINNFFTIIEEEKGRDTRAIIGGVGREDPVAADRFALLVLDVLERRQGHFYPQVSLRRYEGMNQQVYDRSIEILGTGCTFPMLYNDDVNIPSVMRAMDVDRKTAEQYSFFGCGEYMLSGMSLGTPSSALNVAKVLEITLHGGVNPANGKPCGVSQLPMTDDMSFEHLTEIYKKQLDFYIDISGGFEELLYDVSGEEAAFLLDSCLMKGCMEQGLGMLDGGIHHLGGTVEVYGNVTAYDSLTAIWHVVYQQKAFTLTELMKILDADFEGYEKERALLLAAPKFGNDDPKADEIAVHFHEYICNGVRAQRFKTRLDSFLVVVINNSMNTGLGAYVGATPDGRKANLFLSNGNSPYNGQDKQGITALIRSMTKMDTSIHAGANQNLKFSKGMFESQGQEVKALLKTFFDLGGQQTNISVVDQAALEDALIHPHLHENLVVRVGGFTARFIDLEPRVQQDILLRTAY